MKFYLVMGAVAIALGAGLFYALRPAAPTDQPAVVDSHGPTGNQGGAVTPDIVPTNNRIDQDNPGTVDVAGGVPAELPEGVRRITSAFDVPTMVQVPMTFNLRNPRVVQEGRLKQSARGTVVMGRVIEADARIEGEHIPFAEGTFTVTLTMVRPASDMPGQKAGLWHVRGDWKLVDANADPKLLEIRHNPHLMEGWVSAALEFDPLQSDQAWKGSVQIPESLNAGRWMKGIGTYSGSSRFEGKMDISVERKPPVGAILQAAGGR